MSAPGTPSFGRSLLVGALLSASCAAAPKAPTPPAPKAAPAATTPVAPATTAPPATPPAANAPSAPAVRSDALALARAHVAANRLEDAVEAAKEAAERAPNDPAPWLLRAEAERLLGAAAAEAGDGTTAQLRLLDARTSSERATALAPGDAEAWRVRGRTLRDSSQFAEAAAAFKKALDAAGALDGDTLYDLGYCLAYTGDFRRALAAFADAEERLGLQSRIAVNAAICEEQLGDRAAAVARLARFYGAECAAGRAKGADAQRALEKTWGLTVQKLDYEAGKAAFQALAAAHPDRPEPPFMLGNLLSFLGDHAAAAKAYERSLAAEARPNTRLRLAGAFVAAGSDVDAENTIRECLDRNPGLEGTLDTALRVGRALLAGRRPTGARELAEDALKAFPDDTGLLLLAGDGSMAEGDGRTALETYRRAFENASFSIEVEARVARAELAVLRNGDDSKFDPALFAASGAALDSVPAPEPLLDFEETRLFVRPLGGTRIVEGSVRFPAPAAGGTRRVALHFFPDLDATRWSHLDLRVRSEGGAAGLLVEMVDGMDQMSDLPAGRLCWPAPGTRAPLGADWTTVSVPLREFDITDDKRPLPPALARVKCLVLDARAADGKAAVQFGIDSVVLRDAKSGRSFPLQDFDEGISEIGVTYEGTTPPFTRHVASVEMLKDVLPTGTTPVSRGILEGQNGAFDPTMVGRGAGALRVRHGDASWFPSRKGEADGTSTFAGDGAGWVRVSLNPDRDFLRFKALTFLARGEKGGEKLRVRLSDAHDLVLQPEIVPARWPRSIFPRTGKEDGGLALTKEWRMFRIPFAAYPEIDRGALAEIAFELGDEVGNPPGAMIYLDEIGLEY